MKILVVPKIIGAELQCAKAGTYNTESVGSVCRKVCQCQCESRAGPAGVVVEQCSG